MERIIDISSCDGKLWAEDAGCLTDFSKEASYLFSIAVPYTSRECQIFYKDYKKSTDKYKGKYFITLGDYSEELHCTDDYNHHIDHNIVNDSYIGNYLNRDYVETIVLDMDNLTAKSKNEESHIEACIKESMMENKGWNEHRGL